MSRIPTPASIDDSPAGSRELLEGVRQQLGSVPNLFRIVGTSPAALEGYLGLNGALSKGSLPAATRERIALAVAEINGCGYCLAAHTYLGSRFAKLSPEEIEANRRGESADPKADAAVRFAVEIVRQRGQVDASAVERARRAGFTDAELVEIIGHTALNTLTNYVNSVLETAIDFPEVTPLDAGSAEERRAV